MRLPELHVWQDESGRVKRVEFRDGPQRIEAPVVKLVRTDEVDTPSIVEVTLLAKPIYHDSEAT